MHGIDPVVVNTLKEALPAIVANALNQSQIRARHLSPSQVCVYEHEFKRSDVNCLPLEIEIRSGERFNITTKEVRLKVIAEIAEQRLLPEELIGEDKSGVWATYIDESFGWTHP